MGKVQDTISRIARRQKHNGAPSIALIVPSQQKPTKDSFATTYNEVASWLVTQTTASKPTQIVSLTRALQHSNRLQNNATQRLKIISLFATQVNAVKPYINQQFIGADLPYCAEARSAFDSTTTLLQELSYGYKIALVDVLLRRSKLHRLDRIHALYFAMQSLVECGLRYSQSYLPWPDKYWRDINTLLWLAEKENALDDPISAVSNDVTLFPATIRTLYATLAMFHLSNNDHLPAHLMEQLFSKLTSHASQLTLDSEIPEPVNASFYSVAINSANPPTAHRYCNYAAEDEVRYLQLQPLCESLLNSESESEDKTHSLSRLQLQKILHIWSNQTKRGSARSIGNAAVATQTGLKEIHAIYRHWSSTDPLAAQPRWTLMNRSTNGFCLRGNTRDNHQLRIGELIACSVSQEDRHSLHTGVVRWIKNLQQDDLQVGIELIGTDVQAVLGEKYRHGKTSFEPRFEALTFDIGSEGYTTTMILLPADRLRLGDVLQVYPSYNSEISSAFKLAECINLDGNFDCFRLNAVETESERKEPIES